MTTTVSLYTIASAVVAAENAFLGPDRVWRYVSSLQERFISRLGHLIPDLVHVPELETMAALSEEPINAFLRERKFNIQLDPFPKVNPPERAWGAASVLDLTVRWALSGKPIDMVARDGESYKAAELSRDTVSVFQPSNHNRPVAQIRTQTGDTVFMTVCEEQLELFDLLDKVRNISREDKEHLSYSRLIFPTVNLDHHVDISWLKRMWTVDDQGYTNFITQALQQTKLKLNHIGARVKDAVAICGIRETSFKPDAPLVIDRPFLFWIERPRLYFPLFAARITEEVWKDSGSLEDM